MWNEIDVLRDVTTRLNQGGISFMLTGSLALNYYTLPRMTRDVDLVLYLPLIQAPQVVTLFHPDYYVVEEAVQSALEHQSIFNLIHQNSVIQVDCIVRKSDAFRQREFERRVEITLGDFRTWVVSKEDLILSKLFWARESHSDVQLRDVRNLISSGYDHAYIQSWLNHLGLRSLWEEITHE